MKFFFENCLKIFAKLFHWKLQKHCEAFQKFRSDTSAKIYLHMNFNNQRRRLSSVSDSLLKRVYSRTVFSSGRPTVMDRRPSRQSPIDISTTTSVYDPALHNCQFKFDYYKEDFTGLFFDGNSWVMRVEENSKPSKKKLL